MSAFSIRERLQALSGPAEQLRWLGEHRLLGPAGLLAERGLVPEDVAKLAKAWCTRHFPAPKAQLDEERRVLSAFVAADVPALALKGCLLAHGFYSSPEQRWRADLDVLVAPETVDQARAVLNKLGYRPMWAVAGGTPMDQESWLYGEGPGRAVVDLHWDLRNHPVLRGLFPFEEQWRSAMHLPSLGAGVKGQGAVHALISAAMHWFDDLYNQPRPLGWLLDMDLLWRSLSPDQQGALQSLASERRVAGLVAASLDMTRGAFDTSIADEVIDHLTEAGKNQPATALITVNSNPWRAYWFALRCEPGLNAKLRRLRASVFPPAAHMRQRYPDGSRLGLPSLYLKRILRRF